LLLLLLLSLLLCFQSITNFRDITMKYLRPGGTDRRVWFPNSCVCVGLLRHGDGRRRMDGERMDGSVGFHRPWDQYKKGFGDVNGEYWLGLDNIHYLTRRRDYELLVEMSDFDGNNVSARYATFFVGGEHRGYELHISEFTDGGAGDALSSHNGMKFSTFDKDQDPSSYNCAKTYLGGFWHHAYCAYGNPNGAYLWGYDGNYKFGVFWYYWKGYYYSMKNFSMKIRPLV
uniref:Fibrinogen C-terminal domain-containing protein n=1 Tax=Sphaeramia orbicularis TaxID=375764 RepID=A0A673AF17_9TELE